MLTAPRLKLASLVLAASLAQVCVAQTPTWKVEFLGAPQPTWSLMAATSVNDAGLAVGFTYISGYKRGWIAGPSQPLELLPLPPNATSGQPHEINASGVVAGQVLFGSTARAALWRPGALGYDVFLLPSGTGGHVPFDARGINDAGDVVGKYGIFGGSYHWHETTGITQLPTALFPDVPSDVNEQRQIVGGSYRMDLDTLVLEDLGNPTGTSYNYVYTDFACLNDAGECAGYAVVATSQPPYLAVRYSDGSGWTVFNSFPWTSASASGISAAGDTVFQLGTAFGRFVHVEGYGSIALQNIVDPDYADWDVAGSFNPAISRGGRLACTGLNTSTNEAGVVLLTPLAFEDLGGATTGALGTPVLSGYGTLLPGAPARVRIASGAPGSLTFLAWADSSSPIPLYGGTLFPNPIDRRIILQTDALGRAEVNLTWPSAIAGSTFYLQAAVLDQSAPFGVALSNALSGVTR